MKLGDDIKINQCLGNSPNKDSWAFSSVMFSHPGELKQDFSEFWLFCSNLQCSNKRQGKKLWPVWQSLKKRVEFTHKNNIYPVLTISLVNSLCKACNFCLWVNEAHIQFSQKVEKWWPNKRISVCEPDIVDQFAVVTTWRRLGTFKYG